MNRNARKGFLWHSIKLVKLRSLLNALRTYININVIEKKLGHEFTRIFQCILKCREVSLEETDRIWHMDAGCGLLKICSQETSRREPMPLTRKDLLSHTHSIASFRFSRHTCTFLLEKGMYK